jgi:Glutamyl- and glutaminyl-tRNA synthetases
MDLPNPALRDWPALRIQHSPHPIVGDTYKVWPLLDFQSAIEDHLQGVSHIIRGKDLMDSTRKQTILYEHFGWDYPEPLYWGRVKIHEFGGFSTSGMSSSIDSGKFSGWDDPRLPTLRAMRRRGFDPRSLAELWEEVGLTQKDISISLKTLESFNSRIIDGNCERRIFVSNPKSLDLSAENIPSRVMMARHPDGEIEGFREWEVGMTVSIQDSDFVEGMLRLKDFADIIISGSSATIESVDRSDDRKIVHWIPEKLSLEAILSVPDGEEISEVKGVLEDFELTEGEIYQI